MGASAWGKLTSNDLLKGTIGHDVFANAAVGGFARAYHRKSDRAEFGARPAGEQGSLYPALHRLENREWVTSYWGMSENNRKVKFYGLTAKGRRRLAVESSRWLGQLPW